MKVGAVILCRYNSSRLPGKIIKKIKGKSILENIVLRLGQIEILDDIIVATSIEKTDDPIADLCDQKNIPIFRGSLKNVSERFLKAATNKTLDYAIRINGDNIFIDIETVIKMIEHSKAKQLNICSNVPGRTFPFGMSIEILETEFYRKVYQLFKSESDFEHVTKFLYDNSVTDSVHYEKNLIYPELKEIQLAVDTNADYERAICIAEKLPGFPMQYTLKEISRIYKSCELQTT